MKPGGSKTFEGVLLGVILVSFPFDDDVDDDDDDDDDDDEYDDDGFEPCPKHPDSGYPNDNTTPSPLKHREWRSPAETVRMSYNRGEGIKVGRRRSGW